MTIEKNMDGYLEATCDECGEVCGNVGEDFKGFVHALRNVWGWSIFKEQNDWYHYCPDCKAAADFFQSPLPSFITRGR